MKSASPIRVAVDRFSAARSALRFHRILNQSLQDPIFRVNGISENPPEWQASTADLRVAKRAPSPSAPITPERSRKARTSVLRFAKSPAGSSAHADPLDRGGYCLYTILYKPFSFAIRIKASTVYSGSFPLPLTFSRRITQMPWRSAGLKTTATYLAYQQNRSVEFLCSSIYCENDVSQSLKAPISSSGHSMTRETPALASSYGRVLIVCLALLASSVCGVNSIRFRLHFLGLEPSFTFKTETILSSRQRANAFVHIASLPHYLE